MKQLLTKSVRKALPFALSVLAAFPAYAQVPAIMRIGAAGGVRGMVKAFPQGDKAVGRVLNSGAPLFLNEKIATGPDASLQVMLNDETVFTIGPNSVLVLDEFVYDPRSHAGKVTATITNGVFRFVTGQIGHKRPSDMKVKFPVGTLGVRGTIVAGEVSPTSTLAVLLGPGPHKNAAQERVGAFSLANAGAKTEVVKPGFGARIEGPSGAPSAAFAVPQAQLDSLLRAVSGPQARPNDHAASPSAPEDDSQASAGAASEDADQETASASGDLSDTRQVADIMGDAGEAAQTAALDIDDQTFQDLIANSQDTWEDIRGGIVTGTGQYAGTGGFTLSSCNGGACAGDGGGALSVLLNIDFGAKTVGGGGSNVTVTANDSTIAPINETVTFSAQSFAGLSGAASLPFGVDTGKSASGDLSAVVNLLNISGPASHAVAKASYSDATGTTGSGAILVPCSGACAPR